jgi:hypothetical protein
MFLHRRVKLENSSGLSRALFFHRSFVLFSSRLVLCSVVCSFQVGQSWQYNACFFRSFDYEND